MASSSSSSRPSHSIASSSSQSWNYDVFLSFRGEDTRRTFVGHLYAALERLGIYTYKDDETLPRGEFIGSSLRKAIRESQIALIVFSKNYADSSWCLDELSYIMKCKDERGQMVYPIFYDVDPSEVRKQKSKYKEAFAKHELENKSKVESWKKALADAADLAGWETKHVANGDESKCIEEIVNRISKRLHPFISSPDEGLIGIETRLQDLKQRLDMGLGGVRMVGIWGVGGGGKTTLASAVYNEYSLKFDGCSFIGNIRENLSGLKKLQQKVISDVLNGKIEAVRNVEEGKIKIRSRLRHKRVLIVLDDVDNLDHLEALVGAHDWFGEGSRIIITTRNEHLLNTHRVDVIYGVNLLNDDEAIQLLRRHAYRKHKPVEDYELLSKHVISYAGGLPLALKVLGSFLYDKDKNGWMSTLARLKEIPNPTIIKKLKISYDGLQHDEKELFLDIACFFRGSDKDETMMILDACGFYLGIGVTVLIQKALITISNGKFDMHDLIQEMGHAIVRGENHNNPEKHSRVWREKDIKEIFDRHIMMENDKIEAFQYRRFFEDYAWLSPSQVFSHMKKLRFLKVGHMWRPTLHELVSDEHEFVPNGYEFLKDEYEFLSNELRWISWSYFNERSLPTTFQPRKLGGLMLEKSRLIQLWMGYKHLPCLKVLNLSESPLLMRTPDFDGLPNLERLELSFCTNLVEIHQSIGRLKKLVYLNLQGCSILEMFPPIVKMVKLETLNLSWCCKLQKFPEIQHNMDMLKHLDLSNILVKVVPSSFEQNFPNFVSLRLGACLWQRSIEEFLIPPLLSNLQELDLRGNQFSQLPSNLSRLPRLKFLNISKCENLLELPELPSSTVVVKAEGCDSLETVGDLATNCKWLWNVSLWRFNKKCLIGDYRLLQSMLQGNAIEHHFFSLILPGLVIPQGFEPSLVKGNTLQLPHNWSNDFVGFLMYATVSGMHSEYEEITIKLEMDMHSKYETWKEESNNDAPFGCNTYISYVSFSFLKHTTWWNSTYWNSTYSKTLFLSVHFGRWTDAFGLGLGLVPRKSKGDPSETTIVATDCSEFRDEASKKKGETFTIKDDSESSICISWNPDTPKQWK